MGFAPLGFCSTTHSHCNFLLLQHPPTGSPNNILGSSGTMTILIHNNYITIHLHTHPAFFSNSWAGAATDLTFTKRAALWPTEDATAVLAVHKGRVYRKAQHCYHHIHFHLHQSGKHFIFSRAWLRSPLLDRKESLILFFSNQNHETTTFHPICSTSCESVCNCKQNIKNLVQISKGKMGTAWQDGGWQLMFIRTGWNSKLTKPATSKQPKPNMSRGSESKWGRGGGDSAGNPSPRLLWQLLLWDIANLSTQCTRASLLKTSQLAEHSSTYEVYSNYIFLRSSQKNWLQGLCYRLLVNKLPI